MRAPTENGGTALAGELAPLPQPLSSPKTEEGVSLPEGAWKSRPPREWGLRKVGFCQSSAGWEPSCCELEGLETWGVTGQVDFFPTLPLTPNLLV